MKQSQEDLITAFIAGICLGGIIGMFFMAIIRSFLW